jgi:hypothetical protein
MGDRDGPGRWGGRTTSADVLPEGADGAKMQKGRDTSAIARGPDLPLLALASEESLSSVRDCRLLA